MALYDLSNEFQRKSFETRVKFLLGKGSKVELTQKTQRTRKQNSYLHTILGQFAMETGNTIEFVKEEYYKRLCNRDIFEYVVNDPYLGEIKRLKSSSQLSVEESSISIEKFRNWASSECGIYLPSATEHDWLDYISESMEHWNNKQYL